MKCKSGSVKKMTLKKYNKYILKERKLSMNAIMQGAKVMHQYAVMAFARDEFQKLQYHQQKVNTKRQANYRDLLQNVNANSSTGSSHGKSDAFFFISWRCALVSQEKCGIIVNFYTKKIA